MSDVSEDGISNLDLPAIPCSNCGGPVTINGRTMDCFHCGIGWDSMGEDGCYHYGFSRCDSILMQGDEAKPVRCGRAAGHQRGLHQCNELEWEEDEDDSYRFECYGCLVGAYPQEGHGLNHRGERICNISPDGSTGCDLKAWKKGVVHE